MSISPRTALCSGALPSNAKPLCLRTTPAKLGNQLRHDFSEETE